jgi:hypothetical protein
MKESHPPSLNRRKRTPLKVRCRSVPMAEEAERALVRALDLLVAEFARNEVSLHLKGRTNETPQVR